jgi:hypothetical protein
LTATHHETNAISDVGIFTDSLKIKEGKISIDLVRKQGHAYGQFIGEGKNLGLDKILHQTSDIYKGELWIKKYDSVNHIVSGTFWFDAVNSLGEKVEVREGRFDMRFYR